MAERNSNVETLYKKLLHAWNQKDAKSYAALFTDEGSVVGFDGSQMNGRSEIVEALSQIFNDYPTGIFIGVIDEVRALGPQSYMVRAVAGMVPRGYKDINPAVNSIQTLVAVQTEEQWQIALFQNTPAAFHGRPEAQEDLSSRLRDALKASQAH